MPYSNFGYLDPLHIVWRKGTEDDPYIDRVEYLKVVNHKIVLSEIPDKSTRVKITGMREVNQKVIDANELKENEFHVNYSVGIIQVHGSKEAETLNVFYKGRGFIQYPSSRIYHADEFGNVIDSLYNIINESIRNVKRLNREVLDIEEIRIKMHEALHLTNVATDNANRATEDAVVATDKAWDAYETTRLVFQPYVMTYDEISFKYPNPEIGWTVQVYEDGVRYRYDGNEWIPIDLFGGSLRNADENTDGLMSKESYKDLQDAKEDIKDIYENIELVKQDIYDINQNRVLIFHYPYLTQGVNSIIARFPFDGEIVNVRGICSKFGADEITEIDVEKTTDMNNWIRIFDTDSFLTFNVNSYFDNGNHRVIAKEINAGEMFRLNVRTLSQEIEGVTVEIEVKIDSFK